jgi:hypothetical protein
MTIDLFTYLGIRRTRESAIALEWMGSPPEPWTIEDELSLPEELQRLDLFEVVDGEFRRS